MEEELNLTDRVVKEFESYKETKSEISKIKHLENLILLTDDKNPEYGILDSDDRDNVDMINILSNKILDEMGKYLSFGRDRRIKEYEKNLNEYSDKLVTPEEQNRSFCNIGGRLDNFTNAMR